MIKFVIIIVLLAISVFTLVWASRFNKGKKALCNCFESDNVIVFGLKGKGKDLTFNKVINSRDIPCYANIPYNKELCVQKSIEDFSVSPNTFIDILNNDVKLIKKINKERTDMYVSDGGIHLPSQYSNLLCKKYPGLPTYYALNRHLTASNFHINTQYLGRVWDKLREHAGYYIKACQTWNIFGFLVTKIIIYNKYDSAMAQLDPYKASGIIKHNESRANEEDFKAKHGDVNAYYIIQHKSKVYYDSRYFHKVFYGYNSPDTV